MTDEHFYTRLKNRGSLRLMGSDVRGFLQGLVSNDVAKIDAGGLVYACLLTAQGKFLFDFFMRADGDAPDADVVVLDCEGGQRAQDLAKRLSMYKLRADVSIEVEEEAEAFAVFGVDVGYADPRHEGLGCRVYEEPQDMEERGFDVWDARRIALCVPDGSRDLVVEKSTMDEARMDQLNAIDYQKGCYIGQELTARMHYRGLGKKHLAVVDVNAIPQKAELRSSCGSIGLALVRD